MLTRRTLFTGAIAGIGWPLKTVVTERAEAVVILPDSCSQAERGQIMKHLAPTKIPSFFCMYSCTNLPSSTIVAGDEALLRSLELAGYVVRGNIQIDSTRSV